MTVVMVVLGRLPHVLETQSSTRFGDRQHLVWFSAVIELLQDGEGGVTDGGLSSGGIGFERAPALLEVILHVFLALHTEVSKQTVDLFSSGSLICRQPAKLQDLIPVDQSTKLNCLTN